METITWFAIFYEQRRNYYKYFNILASTKKIFRKHLPVSIIFLRLTILEKCRNSRGEDSSNTCHSVWVVVCRTGGHSVGILTKHKIVPEFNPQNVLQVYIKVLWSIFLTILNIILANQKHRYNFFFVITMWKSALKDPCYQILILVPTFVNWFQNLEIIILRFIRWIKWMLVEI